jgi:hypothetical protein
VGRFRKTGACVRQSFAFGSDGLVFFARSFFRLCFQVRDQAVQRFMDIFKVAILLERPDDLPTIVVELFRRILGGIIHQLNTERSELSILLFFFVLPDNLTSHDSPKDRDLLRQGRSMPIDLTGESQARVEVEQERTFRQKFSLLFQWDPPPILRQRVSKELIVVGKAEAVDAEVDQSEPETRFLCLVGDGTDRDIFETVLGHLGHNLKVVVFAAEA